MAMIQFSTIVLLLTILNIVNGDSRSSNDDYGRSNDRNRYSSDRKQYSDKSQSADKYQCPTNKAYEYKLYELVTTLDNPLGALFNGSLEFTSTVRFLPCGAFDEFFSLSIVNVPDLVVSLILFVTDRYGVYKFKSDNQMLGTGFGYITASKSETDLLATAIGAKSSGNSKATNAVVVAHDYDLKFTSNRKRCSGTVEYAVYIGGGLFDPNSDPVLTATGKISCELVKVRRISS